MREIKYQVILKNKPFGEERLAESGWESQCYDLNPDKGIRWDKMVFTGEGYIRRQYTGLKDKNGKEIYEGDKMKIQLPMGGFWGNVRKEKIGTVRYESDHGGFIVEWEYSKNQHHVLLDCDIAFEGEIIGNIYETN